MTLGQDRVRTKFNPEGKPLVAEIKAKAAELIDLCEKGRNLGSVDGEHQRLWALAQTQFEDGAMWAVKAATFSVVLGIGLAAFAAYATTGGGGAGASAEWQVEPLAVNVKNVNANGPVARICAGETDNCWDVFGQKIAEHIPQSAVAWYSLRGLAQADLASCEGDCRIKVLYDQTGHGNDLTREGP